MDERTRFVLEQERGLHTMTELCENYDIARETGYYWLCLRLSLRREQGQGKLPLPLLPINPLQHKQRRQGCARSKMSGMSPAAQAAFSAGSLRFIWLNLGGLIS